MKSFKIRRLIGTSSSMKTVRPSDIRSLDLHRHRLAWDSNPIKKLDGLRADLAKSGEKRQQKADPLQFSFSEIIWEISSDRALPFDSQAAIHRRFVHLSLALGYEEP